MCLTSHIFGKLAVSQSWQIFLPKLQKSKNLRMECQNGQSLSVILMSGVFWDSCNSLWYGEAKEHHSTKLHSGKVASWCKFSTLHSDPNWMLVSGLNASLPALTSFVVTPLSKSILET